MSNVHNEGNTLGRLTRDPIIIENKDGSHKVLLTVAAKDNFRSKHPETKVMDYQSQFIPLEAFISSDRSSKLVDMYRGLRKGQLIAAKYAIKTPSFVDAKGERQYPIVLQISEISTQLESRATVEAREASRQLAEASAAPEVPADEDLNA